MADLATLESALRKADAMAQAGDQRAATDAKRIADEIRRATQGALAPAPEAPPAPDQAAPQPQTGMFRQATSGLNEGIANAVGLPVDAVTAVLNMGFRAAGLAPIERPVGGSESIRGAMGDTLISPVAPQTAAQRFARRIGQDVGAGAVMGPAMGVRTAGGLALNAAADAGAGIAGATSREIAPDNTWADLAASVAGGAGVVAGARALRPSPTAPSRGDLSAERQRSYATVEADTTRLSAGDTADLKRRISDAVTQAKMHPGRHPRASSMVDDLFKMQDPTLTELDQWRQVVSRDVAGSMDGSEARLGQIIKDTIDDFVGGIQPGRFSEETVDALRSGRDLTRRLKSSDLVDNAIERGERRAASTGTGGNAVNAIRQNIRSILDDPRKARGFTIAEREAMEQIVRGTSTTNALRMAGRFAPTSGAFPMAGTMAQVAGAGATGNPLWATPAVVGGVSKALGERLTERQVARLSDMIRAGGRITAKEALTETEFNVLKAVLAVTAANAQSDGM